VEVKGEHDRVNKYFRLQLTLILIVFSLVISGVIVFFDYGKLKDALRTGQETKITMVEDKIIHSLFTIDSVYSLLDQQTGDQMKGYSDEMLALYEVEPNFDKWDFQEMKNRYGMDIYVISADNKIEYSSFKQDIGLDFNECCRGLGRLLDDRREGNSFTHDGMDLQQYNGAIKKFSYAPTRDKKYLLELGVSLEDEAIFKKFDFMKTIAALESEYKAINSIRIYNSAGFLLGFPEGDVYVKELSPSMLPLLKKALKSGKPQERAQKVDGNYITNRYIPYVADENRGLSTKRAVEIVYNDAELNGLLVSHRNKFILQLFVILIAAVGLSFIIARLVAKPIHLAFHDSLTGLKNRAAIKEDHKNRLARKNSTIALMMIDIDNFKMVNDSLGHIEGDRILRLTALAIQDIVGRNNVASRIGGDEFVVVFSEKKEDELRRIAKKMVDKINEELSTLIQLEGLEVSISIGIAFAEKEDEADTLYTKADRALYMSKENGKNQYNFYTMA